MTNETAQPVTLTLQPDNTADAAQGAGVETTADASNETPAPTAANVPAASMPPGGTPLDQAREMVHAARSVEPVPAPRQAHMTDKTRAEIEAGKAKVEEHRGRQAMLDAKRRAEEAEALQAERAKRANSDLG